MIAGSEINTMAEDLFHTFGNTPKPLWLQRSQQADVYALSWPATRVSEAIEYIAQQLKSGVRPQTDVVPPLDLNQADDTAVARWLELSANTFGLEAEPTETTYVQAAQLIQQAGPSLLQLPHVAAIGETRFLVLLRSGWRRINILGPDGLVHRVSVTTIRETWGAAADTIHRAAVDQLLESMHIADSRRSRARQAILDEQLGSTPIGGCWLLRLAPQAPLWALARQARIPSAFGLFIGSALMEQGCVIAAWVTIGSHTLAGHMDWTWVVGWALLLISAATFLALGTLAQGQLAARAGSLFKQRLLYGALQLQPDEVRHQGIGHFLGQVMESEAVELVGLSEGFVAIFALLQLLIAAMILAFGAGGWPHAFLLLFWIALTGVLTWRYWRRGMAWTTVHVRMARDLIEQMIGHRTRLAQTDQTHWHTGEDQALEQYFQLSTQMDQAVSQFIASVPRGGMLVVGVGGLIPAIMLGQAPTLAFVISLGGIFLALQAWLRLTTGIQGIMRAVLAWQQIRPLFAAASRSEELPPQTLVSQVRQTQVSPSGTPQTVLNTHDLTFRYHANGRLILRDCTLQIQAGDRLLLEGPSGGGKSTLAALLAGLRTPDSGLLFLHGADWHTRGTADWRRRVVSVPQFHENHVFTGTLAFNLLMGRHWPPRPDDLQEAEIICRELGLGELIDRMPAGMEQMVGEHGWQLSHGERSRLYMARALLQQPDVIICDESFGALDPENLTRALRCALRRAPTLLVIAHP